MTAAGEVLDRIGRTPLEELDAVWVKLECANPGGSVKDRLAKFLLEAALARGEVRPGDTVVEATSGNTGIAMSLVARELGLKSIIFMPESMSVERRRMIEALGAEVRLTPAAESFKGAIERRDAYRGQAGFYVPDQFANPDNVRCHRTTTGPEIALELRQRGVGTLDAFVAGTGTGGTLMGIGEALRAVYPRLVVVAVEPRESAVMSGGDPGEHGIQGIGDGFIPDLVDMSAVGEVAVVSTDEARQEARRIHDTHGYCIGMSAGANHLAARRLVERGWSVATVWPDCSDRYLSLGLEPPEASSSRCPLTARCSGRLARLAR